MSDCAITSMPLVAGLAGLAIGLALGYLGGRGHAGGKPKSALKGNPGRDPVAPDDRIELYVGNLPYKVTERDLKTLFGAHGKVHAVRLIKNKGNGKSRGYAFVEMIGRPAAERAVKAMSGTEVKGRKLVVNEAKSPSRE